MQQSNEQVKFNLPLEKKIWSTQSSLSLFNQYAKVFKIHFSPNEKTFDITQSFLIDEDNNVERKINSECYNITIIEDCGVFSTPQTRTYDLCLTYDEIISEDLKQELLEAVGVEIDGDGAIFQIKSQRNTVKLIFEKQESFFIETEYLKKGEIILKKW